MIPLGIICFLCGTMYCIFYAKAQSTMIIYKKDPLVSQIWTITPPIKSTTVSLSSMPLPFCSRVRAPRMSPSFEVNQNASIPYSDVDATFWIRVGNSMLNTHNPNVDRYISGSLHQSGVWEPPIVKSIEALLPTGGVFVDVGANIGYFSLYAALKGARVFSFEPMLYNVVQMQRTLAKNTLPKWRVYHNAVSEVTGDVVRLRTTDHLQNAGNHKIGPSGEAAYTVRLDDVIHEDVDFMKVDVEGYEAFVLAGAVELFCKYTVKALILEMTQDIHSSGCNVNQMLKWLQCMGYEMRSMHNPTGPKVYNQGRESNALWVLGGARRVDCCNQ